MENCPKKLMEVAISFFLICRHSVPKSSINSVFVANG